MTRAEGFAAVPNWMIREKRVPRNAILVYASLSSRAGMGAIFPSQATIAEESGLSERTVRRMMTHLEEIGVVERRARRGHEGRANSRTDAYTLHPNGRIQGSDNLSGRSERPDKDGRATGQELQVTPLIEVDREEVDRESSDVARDALPAYRPEIYELCEELADAVRANGHKVGTVGQTWWAACDRLMRLDGYTPDQIGWMIGWSTSDEFWSANIRSMPTLRDKFSTLVAQAKRARNQRPSPTERATDVLDLGQRMQGYAESIGRVAS